MTDQAIPALRILVPFDVAARNRAALAFVSQLDFGSLTLLHVEPDSTGIIPGAVVEEDEHLGGLHNELEEIVASFRTGNRQVQVQVRSGDPAHEILRASRDVDLIVMATRARGLAARAFFGSVADQVGRQSGTPTVMIRDQSQATERPARIVTPLDGSPIGESALPTAMQMAQACECPIHLVRAVDFDDVRAEIREQKDQAGGTSYEDALTQARQEARTYLQKHQRQVQAAGVECGVEILDGTPSFALLREIVETDLVVMSSHGRSGYKRWIIGSVAEKLVRESKAPVVLVPGPEIDVEE